METKNQNGNLIYSYLALRKAIGWIGILLPFTLLVGNILFFGSKSVLQSISHYYYSGMRDLFVGEVCAIALFLFFYKGYDNWDKWVANFAGLCAVGVAFFPTTTEGINNWTGVIHFYCAAGFFLSLSGFSIFLFTRKGPDPTPEKLRRNIIYVVCGLVIIVCMMAILIYFNFINNDKPKSGFVFWTETVALIAFGLSWLTKGGTLYPDKE